MEFNPSQTQCEQHCTSNADCTAYSYKISAPNWFENTTDFCNLKLNNRDIRCTWHERCRIFTLSDITPGTDTALTDRSKYVNLTFDSDGMMLTGNGCFRKQTLQESEAIVNQAITKQTSVTEQAITEIVATPSLGLPKTWVGPPWLGPKQCKSPVATWNKIIRRSFCIKKCDAYAEKHGYTSGAFCCAHSSKLKRCHVAADNDAELASGGSWKRRLLHPTTSTP